MSENNGSTGSNIQVPHILPTVPEAAQLGLVSVGTATIEGKVHRIAYLTVSAPGRSISLMMLADDLVAWGKRMIKEGTGIEIP